MIEERKRKTKMQRKNNQANGNKVEGTNTITDTHGEDCKVRKKCCTLRILKFTQDILHRKLKVKLNLLEISNS